MKNFLDPVEFPGVLVLGFKSSERCNTFNFVECLGVKLCFIYLGFPGVNLKNLRGWGWEEGGGFRK